MITNIGKVSSCCCDSNRGKLGGTGNTKLFQSWGPLYDILSGAERKRAIELNNKIEELNKSRVAAGKLTQAQADAAEVALWSENPDDYRELVGEDFGKGLEEGIKAEQEFLELATNKFLKTAADYVPTAVWIGVGVFALYYLGIFDGLKGSLSTKRQN
jgi:hypothetical protein